MEQQQRELLNVIDNADVFNISESQRSTKDTKLSALGHRHLIVIWGFSMLAFVSLHKTLLAVVMVAMVNHTQIRETLHINRTTESCDSGNDSENNKNHFKVEGEFDWDSQLQGYVLGAHSMSYIFTNFMGGRVAEILGAKRTIFYANTITAVLTILTPFSAWWNIYVLIIGQLARGFAQGFVSPSVFVIMANWFPRKERGFLSSLTMNGYGIGALLGAVLTGWLCDIPELGWPSALYIWGGIQGLLSILFLICFHELPKNHPGISKEELKYILCHQENDLKKKRPPIPWGKILKSFPVHALIVGMFGLYWSANQFMSVHPIYIGTVLHFNMTQNGLISSLPLLASTFGCSVSGFLTGWLTKNNLLSVNAVRKGCTLTSAIGFSFCLVGVILAKCDGTINIICFTLALVFHGIGVCGSMIISGDMSPTFAGSLFGFTSAISSLANILLPIVVGAMTKGESMEEWHKVFYVHIGVVMSCGIFFQIFGSAEIQPWNNPETTTTEDTTLS